MVCLADRQPIPCRPSPIPVMRLTKTAWYTLGVIFAAASIAIHYEVKIVLRQQKSGSVQELGNVKVGQQAPDFTLQDLAGNPVTLASYRGKKTVLVDFWATWCSPCRMAMPDLQDTLDLYRNRGLEILSVNQGENVEDVRSFINRKKYTFHV